jgi:hypothetical protein
MYIEEPTTKIQCDNLKMSNVNKPKVSRFIVGTYVGLVVFIAAVIAFFTYAGLLSQAAFELPKSSS